MYSTLYSLVRGSCQQLFKSLNSHGRLIVGNVEVQRPLLCSAVRLQESDAKPVETQSPSEPVRRLKDLFPPFPGEDSPLRWDSKKFEELPIAHVKATYNNTHIQVTDCAGQYMVRTSCGTEGFKNVKKSTPIAAQTAGISAAAKARAKGVTYVRVLVKGLGPGRFSAIKGLTMGGLEVVSITDNTPVPHNGCRPRKARRM
ncbi:small ribosomal subunit protein uS11m [Danio rerio]|uniref:Small ribosomal subunit protein uS11m n=1 Tax=Danio rerio TaxID=7955 RepID=Q5VSI2_DANRE|nr:28S ribosomal protein S11, mitochondrial [Danio rerio]AAI34988.1 Zgc:162401 protein [Danio rerio]AAI71530.1 Si:dkey-265m8.2 [Danio rerio]AAI71532.1 Si:dkey-265m8.2 [Danio rerio]CAH69072.1 novel protein similar to mouse and human mitochondrial ribosomal protein S11 (MRPS11) [Danio rerio]|eukprot:NP_001038262.1 28S ribosomal protein S11, mitochondrial [Danio rerio]